MALPEWAAIILVTSILSAGATIVINFHNRITRLEREAVLRDELKQELSHLHDDSTHIRARVDTLYDNVINGVRGG